MPTNSGSVSSVHSSSVPLSVKNQTKDKFDALLKTAFQKKLSRKGNKSISKEKLINNLESTASSENLLCKQAYAIELNEFKSPSTENYILNKFLDQQSNKYDTTSEFTSTETQNDKISIIKPPIPKPRKKMCITQSGSQGTFEVTSPKVVKNLYSHNKDDANSPNSFASKGTFKVASPQILKNIHDNTDDESSSTKKTYNLEEVGDVLIHKSPIVPKIIKRTKHEKKSDTETASENESKTSRGYADNRTVETNDNIETLSKRKILPEDTIESVDENRKNKKSDIVCDDNVNPKNRYSYKKIIEIIIHKTDRLQLSSLVVHPMVKIHIIDVTNGKYFPKSDKSRSVVFFYENNDNDYISPVMTHACNLQEKRILYPSWQESILLNEDYEYFQDGCNHIILFFEIMDFVSFAALQQLNDKECTSGWHSIAFAFLKVSGKHGSLNIGKKMRLQLYYSCQSKKYNPQICNPWIWWKKRKLKKYPSTLHVTIKSTISPSMAVETFRSKTPIQKETSSTTKLCDDVKNTKVQDLGSAVFNLNNSDSKLSSTNWSRKNNETCKLPNKCLVQFNSYDQGCFVMKFSHSGVYLACAVQIENLYYVILYSVILLREVNKFCSHQALIYDIKWSKNDTLLLSASADNTVSVYNLTLSLFFQILPHPSFVYCCDITHEKLIASGCHDGIIRIWNQQQDTKFEFQLLQELEAHTGYVTSLCFGKKPSLFSADSSGIIIEWHKEGKDWILNRQINLLDLKENVINQISLFSKERKLLVHSRDSIIRIIDVKSGCVLQWLRGGLNKRFQIFASISPCGTFICSGSENGVVHVWNSKTGRQIASYIPSYIDNQFLTIHCVDFHPVDNILAVSHYGKNVPILLYHFDETIQHPTINVTIKDDGYSENKLEQSKSDTKVNEISRKIQIIKKNDDKLNFKGVLQKMDMVISSQINS